MVERGAAPAGEGTFPSHSGSPGTPPGRHYGRSARSSLDWPARIPVQEARPGVDGGMTLEGDACKCRGGAPGGGRIERCVHAFAAGLASLPHRREYKDAPSRRSAPSPLVRGRECRRTPRLSKNRGSVALAKPDRVAAGATLELSA